MVKQVGNQPSAAKTGFENKARRLRFLSLCFAYPNSAFLPNLRERLQGIEKEKQIFETQLRLFEQENHEQLQGEYTRLFITGYPTTPCPPYESVFREERMFGSCTGSIHRFYEEWSMTADAGLLDHISTELEFLAFLASAATLEHPGDDAVDAFAAFAENHLFRWLPDFSTALEQHAKLAPYRHLGSLLETAVPLTL